MEEMELWSSARSGVREVAILDARRVLVDIIK